MLDSSLAEHAEFAASKHAAHPPTNRAVPRTLNSLRALRSQRTLREAGGGC